MIYAVPLVVCLFALYAAEVGRTCACTRSSRRSPPRRRRRAARRLCRRRGTGQSFVLVSLQELERLIGDVGLASLAFAAVARLPRRSSSSRPRATCARDGGGAGRDRGRRSGNDRGGRHPLREQPRAGGAVDPPRRSLLGRRCRSGPVTLLRRTALGPGRPADDALLEPLGSAASSCSTGPASRHRSPLRPQTWTTPASRRHDRSGPRRRARLLARPPRRRTRRNRARRRRCGDHAAPRSSR